MSKILKNRCRFLSQKRGTDCSQVVEVMLPNEDDARRLLNEDFIPRAVVMFENVSKKFIIKNARLFSNGIVYYDEKKEAPDLGPEPEEPDSIEVVKPDEEPERPGYIIEEAIQLKLFFNEYMEPELIYCNAFEFVGCGILITDGEEKYFRNLRNVYKVGIDS